MTVGIVLAVCGVSGVIAGMIAYSKFGTAGAFAGYGVFGFVVPLIGIVAAVLAKPDPLPAVAQPAPGWYSDPWGEAPLRWWDGGTWTPATAVATDR